MAAYWMARCGVRARIIDKKSTKVFTGQADGLRVRTLEIFDSIGFQHRVQHEGHVAVEANFWVWFAFQYLKNQLMKVERNRCLVQMGNWFVRALSAAPRSTSPHFTTCF